MPFEQLSCKQLKSWLDENKTVQIIDIRDQQSFMQGHIEGAHHIHNENVASFISAARKDQPIVVCCYHGNSSQGAADYFNQQGFAESYSLSGGYEAWKLVENV